MLKRHFPPCGEATQPPARPALGRIAHVALSLPALAAEIPTGFTVVSGTTSLPDAAATLAHAGILAPCHWNGDLSASVRMAITHLATQYRPQALAPLSVTLSDDLSSGDPPIAENDYDCDYQRTNNLAKGSRIGGLIVVISNDDLYHVSIGPAIRRLETHRLGLGHTVLRTLHEALMGSCRSLNPVSGIHWAGHNYWMGEEDESSMLEERLPDEEYHFNDQQSKLPKEKRIPFDREKAIKEMGIFRRVDYDNAIPKWAGTGHFKRRPLSLAQLSRLRVGPRYRRIVRATIEAVRTMHSLPRHSVASDMSEFNTCCWETVPYLLRWHCPSHRKTQDPLAQLYDDFMNVEFQSGETIMDINAIFAFHDASSFVRAVKRFGNYCRLLNAAEQLLRLISTRV